MLTRRHAGLLAAATPLAAALPAAAQQAAPAQPGFHRFSIGGFTATTIFDGTARLNLPGFVLNAPIEQVQATLAESFLPTDHYITPYTMTVVDTGRALVLFDAGTGGQLSQQATQGMANMRAAGIDPARITHVVLTHVHGDHITGLTTREGEAIFPNAELVVPDAEWRYWTDRSNEAAAPERQRPNFANVARRFAPYASRTRRVMDGQEAVAGVRAVLAAGHSPGHTCWHVADGNAQFMVLGDITHRPELFARQPGFHVMFDFDPAAAAETRRRLLDRVAADRIRVTGYHFPFPAHGYMARLPDGGFRYVASDWMIGVG